MVAKQKNKAAEFILKSADLIEKDVGKKVSHRTDRPKVSLKVLARN